MEGWTLNVAHGSEIERYLHYGECQDDNRRYGFEFFETSMKTTLYGYGKARLDFGNCRRSRYSSNVRAYLNENEIGKATINELSKKIEFDFNNGDTLELKGYIIRFNNFTVLSCLRKE